MASDILMSIGSTTASILKGPIRRSPTDIKLSERKIGFNIFDTRNSFNTKFDTWGLGDIRNIEMYLHPPIYLSQLSASSAW